MRLSKVNKLKAIWELVEEFKSELGGQAKGHFYTTISVLEKRAEELEKEIDNQTVNVQEYVK